MIWPFQDREYAESVRIEVVSRDAPVVEALRSEPESTLQPEYRRLGAELQAGDEVPGRTDISVTEPSVVVETVKYKLLRSAPFVPDWSGADGDVRLRDGRASVILGPGHDAGGTVCGAADRPAGRAEVRAGVDFPVRLLTGGIVLRRPVPGSALQVPLGEDHGINRFIDGARSPHQFGVTLLN